MTTEAKIGLAVVAVAICAVLWFASGRREATAPPHAQPQAGATPRQFSRLGRMPLKDQRRRERFEKLRRRRLPTPAIAGGSQPSQRTSIPFDEAFDEGDVDPDDFDSLSQMALSDEDPDNRIVAAWLLASLEDEPVIPVLAKVLNDPDPEVRLAAIESLSDLEDIEDNPPLDLLGRALEDDDPEVRFEALSIVTEIGGPRTQPLVDKALSDPDEDVRSLAESLLDLEDTFFEDAPLPGPEAVQIPPTPDR